MPGLSRVRERALTGSPEAQSRSSFQLNKVVLERSAPAVSVSNSPLVVRAASTVESHGSPFMYGPPGQRDLVVIDTSSRIERIRKLPSWTAKSTPLASSSARAYFVQAIPGKGRGLVAARDISYGETILEELPTLLVADGVAQTLSDMDMESVLEQAVAGLSPTSKVAVKSQINCHPQLPPLIGTLITNTFGRRLDQYGSLGSARALYNHISCANHSCVPNANYQSHFNDLEGTLHAVRSIKAGEEITISYIAVVAKRTERQAILAEYAFECQCECCVLSPTKSKRSDDRRMRLKAFLSPGATHSTEDVDHALHWVSAENLASAEPDVLLAGVVHHTSQGRKAQGKRWERRFRSACEAVCGEVSAEKEARLARRGQP